MADLATRLVNVIGDKSFKPLEKAFGMRVVEDLLRHYPRRYAEIGTPTDLSDLRVGQHVTILAEVVSATVAKFGSGGKRSRTEVIVTDGQGRLSLTFFQQPWLPKSMTPGTTGLFSGEVTEFNGRLQLTHPDHDLLGGEGDMAKSRLARGVIPLYKATAKISTWSIENCVGMCLDTLDYLEDSVPGSVRQQLGHADIRSAFESIHRPHSIAEAMKARDRFRVEEAFVVQTVVAQRRLAAEQERAKARPFTFAGLRERFEEQLPFVLTAGQREVIDEISTDLDRSHPMHRLLQGEVGSGKTIVALLAMLQVIDSGGQAALLAPTEVLASQHFRAISAMLGCDCSPDRWAPNLATSHSLTPHQASPASRSARMR